MNKEKLYLMEIQELKNILNENQLLWFYLLNGLNVSNTQIWWFFIIIIFSLFNSPKISRLNVINLIPFIFHSKKVGQQVLIMYLLLRPRLGWPKFDKFLLVILFYFHYTRLVPTSVTIIRSWPNSHQTLVSKVINIPFLN